MTANSMLSYGSGRVSGLCAVPANLAKACSCGHVFAEDALYCQRCGLKRPEVSFRILCNGQALHGPWSEKAQADSGGCGSSPQKAPVSGPQENSELASAAQEVILLLRETLFMLCEQLRIAQRNNELLEEQCARCSLDLSRAPASPPASAPPAARPAAPEEAVKPQAQKVAKVVTIQDHQSEDEMPIEEADSPCISEVDSEMFEPNSPSMVNEMWKQFRRNNGGTLGCGSDFNPNGSVDASFSDAASARDCAGSVASSSALGSMSKPRQTLKYAAGAERKLCGFDIDSEADPARASASSEAEEARGRSSTTRSTGSPAADSLRKTQGAIQRRLPPGLADGQPPRRLTLFTGAKRASQFSDVDSADEPAG